MDNLLRRHAPTSNADACCLSCAVDTKAPTLTVPARLPPVKAAPSQVQAQVLLQVSAVDTVTQSPNVTCSYTETVYPPVEDYDYTPSPEYKQTVAVPAYGGVFPLGDTRVSCTARDSAGNSASAQFMVTVGECKQALPLQCLFVTCWRQ